MNAVEPFCVPVMLFKETTAMTTFSLRLTDGAGDGGYAVDLRREASTWEDMSSAGHEICSITQGGNVVDRGGTLACDNTAGGYALVLHGANWNMSVGDTGNADRQHDPGGNVERDWEWEVTRIT
jgi:hypothetical protein